MSALSERLAKAMLRALMDEYERIKLEQSCDDVTASVGIDAICEVVTAGIAALDDPAAREVAFERVVYAGETGAAGQAEVH